MAVHRVPADFRTIQAAVEEAAPGDTIRVAGGIYAESVRIGPGKDRLAIIGAGPGNAILQGEGRGAGFLIEGSGGVTIAGFTVTGFGIGIDILTSDNVIRRNELKRNRPAIEAQPPADTDNVFDENRVK